MKSGVAKGAYQIWCFPQRQYRKCQIVWHGSRSWPRWKSVPNSCVPSVRDLHPVRATQQSGPEEVPAIEMAVLHSH